MRSKDCEGQINLFGSEPFIPKKGQKEPVEEVQLDTEFEEFLSVGKKTGKIAEQLEKKTAKRQSAQKIAKETDKLNQETVKSGETETEQAQKPEAGKTRTTGVLRPALTKPGELHAVMQKSFCTGDGRKATVAYVDYNSVYVMGFDGEISFIQYPDSKRAVDEYLNQMGEFAKKPEVKESKEHPKLEKAECRMAE